MDGPGLVPDRVANTDSRGRFSEFWEGFAQDEDLAQRNRHQPQKDLIDENFGSL